VFVILSVLHYIAGVQNVEADACLDTWQTTGAAAISKLDHDSASDSGSLHQSVADSLKIAELGLHLASPGYKRGKAAAPAKPRESSTTHRPLVSPDAFQLCEKQKGSAPMKLPTQNI
jgi:hypothetical protein